MKTSLACAALAVVSLNVFSTANAATNLGFHNLSGAEYDSAGVYVLGEIAFNGTDDDTGTGFDDVLFQLFDDGTVKFQQTYSVAVGSSGLFTFETYYPGLVGTSARGVGLYLSDVPNSSLDFVIDPYDVPHYADPSECEVDCGPVGVIPEPSTWAMVLSGFAAIGATMRRRRRASVSCA